MILAFLLQPWILEFSLMLFIDHMIAMLVGKGSLDEPDTIP